MRVVVALGGNALAAARRADDRRGAARERRSRRRRRSRRSHAGNQLVITHGNGPQVGLLALQGAAYKPDEAYPLDVLGAETEGMIGYMIEQELGNLLPFEVPVRDAADDGRGRSRRSRRSRTRPSSSARSTTKPTPSGSRRRRAGRSSRTATSGGASSPRRSPSASSSCGRSSGCSSTARSSSRPAAAASRRSTSPAPIASCIGVEAVIDKDLCSELLARELERRPASSWLTDADAVYVDWGKPTQRAIRRASPTRCAALSFAAGSMGPKVDAACRFAARPASARRSARSRISRRSWGARRARRSPRKARTSLWKFRTSLLGDRRARLRRRHHAGGPTLRARSTGR